MTHRLKAVPAVVLSLLFVACAEPESGSNALVATSDDGSGHIAPTAHTITANAAVLDVLPFDDTSDFDDARRGFIASREDPVILGADGREVWNLAKFAFVEGDPPDSVNPSLWRQAKLNGIHGLFEVTPGVYQVRGYDLANMTLVAGETGWIVIDPLTTRETSEAAMALVAQHLGRRPVKALIYTHSHIDHFGGAGAVVSAAEAAGGVPVIAPEGFLVEAVSENVLAGTTMSRRASYMFGFLLERGPRGHVDSGLGRASTPGTFTLTRPNETITKTGTERTIDGVRMIFQNTPNAEAPAEMMIYFPDLSALCGAENVSHVLHNLYTLRGAKVRDALLWSSYLDETIRLFGGAKVLFASHHWPTWGNEAVIDHLKKQRDAYKYLHDETLRLANQGLTSVEIAEEIAFPPSLALNFANRGYYGTVSHNAKAVYQHYFGWFDGNPANLNPLPPTENARRYVDYMGGAAQVIEKARGSYAAGDYRWVATVLNHVVFADPRNQVARDLLADTYDQLGYQAESGPWRDFYLTGANELRGGSQELPFETTGSSEIVAAIPTSLFFDALAVRTPGEKAVDREGTVLNFVFTDIGETHVVTIENGVLHHREGSADPDANATMTLRRTAWDQIVTGKASLPGLLLSGEVDLDGSRLDLLGFFAMLDTFDPAFDIVTP
jgi:alkyl sulfatase BDS1-like metallo-beta-lactamase superfamily hydrolase